MLALVPRDSFIGLVIGPLIWAGYFVLSYVVSGSGCSLGFGESRMAGISIVQILVLAAGAFAAVLIIAAGLQAMRGRRDVKKSSSRAPEAQQRQAFLYGTSAILCGLSLVGTIWLAMAAAIAPVC